MKRIVASLIAFIALASSLSFAQNKTSLNIICDQAGAQVYINGRLAGTTTPNFSFLVPQGPIQVRVQKNGFRTFETVVQAGSQPVTLNVSLPSLTAPPAVVPPPSRQTTFPLTINCNVPNANILVNGASLGMTPYNGQILAGTYTLVVRAAGYSDYTQTFVVNGPTNLMATLGPTAFTLSVSANVEGAEVLVNGNSAGRTPFSAQVPGGSYNVVVRAPGYVDFSQTVVVSGAAQVLATLQPTSYQLNVAASNYAGAQVLINGNPAGQTPYAGLLPPGSYLVTIRAPGFIDYTAQITLTGPEVVSATLQPLNATWQVLVPETFLAREYKGRHLETIELFVDGAHQKGMSGQVTGGRHTFRFVIGGIAFERAFDFQAGKTYTIEPAFGLNMK